MILSWALKISKEYLTYLLVLHLRLVVQVTLPSSNSVLVLNGFDVKIRK